MNMRFDKQTLTMAFRVSVVPALMTVVAACSPVNFSTVDNNSGTGVAQATPTPAPGCSIETVYRQTKIMFVVDASGSNNDPSGGVYNNINGINTWFPNSDPAKTFRGGAINDFFSNYQHKTNFDWSFVTFQGSSAHAYIGSDSNPQFSTNASDMRNAINAFYGASDSGQTPYAAGLSMATRAIQNDPDLNSANQPNYYVIFLSDGFPTDYTDMYGNFKTAQMQSDVGALRAAAPGRVTLSTIYYAASGQQIPVAVSDLKAMASAGGGQFASVNTSNTTFKIDDVISTGCH